MIKNKDYPFGVIIEKKVSKAGKEYQSVAVSFTRTKNKEATDPKEKYETVFFNLFDEKDLLKLAHICTKSYDEVRGMIPAEEQKQEQSNSGWETSQTNDDPFSDEIPF